jgi:murein DD-endopeptidase MepM/ murein hydrolase activator NlpD
MRHYWAEGVLATALTLCVVTAAYATTAFAPLVARPAPAYAKVAEQVPAPPPEPPPPAFAFGEPAPGYRVNSPFGLRRMPWERHGRLHEGVDIAAPAGKPVVAVADGVITKAGQNSSYGRYVEVRHAEGLVSFYAHLGRIDARARAGVAVKAGTMLGKIGSSGTSTGPHLHFEMRQNDRPLNPVSFIGREFATAADLPLKTAAYYSKRVRVAHVSQVPKSKKELVTGARKTEEGRVVATLQVAAMTAD